MSKPNPSTITLHHTIPRSAGGSDSSTNLSHVKLCRHQDFHKWANYHIPTELVRLLIIQAIGYKGKTLPHETIHAIFQKTKLRGWSQVYKARALSNVANLKAVAQAEQAKERECERIIRERNRVMSTLRMVSASNCRHYRQGEMLTKALAFFDTDDPTEAIAQILTENNGKELLWSKGLKSANQRNLIAEIQRHAKKLSKSSRVDIRGVLESHLGMCEQLLREYEIIIDEFKCFTAEEVARKLQLSDSTIYRYINDGKLRAYKFGGTYRIKAEDLNDFLKSQMLKQRQPKIPRKFKKRM